MKEIGTKIIETKRLILRRIEENDYLQAYENWTGDKLVERYVTWDTHENAECTREYFSSKVDKYEDKLFFDWVVELKENSQVIGEIEARPSKQDDLVEIGYCYGSRFWNRGYASEALKAVVDYMFTEVKVRKVLTRHMGMNPASGMVMKKAGMKIDAVLKGYVIDKKTGKPDDFHMYSIDYEEWKS
ncbi:GNAT family N-acetyltransferase [Lagierella sp.]|uniref:GNAT family N-acetyltransferase n=1 Tax=Lagierella sp. TaxID=2849657 RepID=UPI00261CEE1F|nr:GNAT family N-acetyltransferase [Lagierella sp.]